jgi:AcrR family transcriptional regulator
MSTAAQLRRRANRRSRREKKAETRRQLLNAAATVFARRSFHGASVEDIAAEAGLTTGALYWHFKSKEELFLALADEQVAKRIEEIHRAGEASDHEAALDERIERQFQRFVAREAHWPLLYYEFWAYGTRDPRLSREFTKRRRAVQGAIADRIATQAEEFGLELPVPANQIALGLNGLMNGLAFERVADRRAVPDGLAGFLISRYMLGVLSAAQPAQR